MAKGTGTLFSAWASGTIGKTIVYSAKGVRKIMRADRLVKNWGSPLIFFEDAIFGMLCRMHFDDPWFSFFSLEHFFTYFTKKAYTSNTPAQQAIRGTFKLAYEAWALLTDEQKAPYEENRQTDTNDL